MLGGKFGWNWYPRRRWRGLRCGSMLAGPQLYEVYWCWCCHVRRSYFICLAAWYARARAEAAGSGPQYRGIRAGERTSLTQLQIT